ncbi:MAG: BTAD domain-containing putative transcriptional regulator [Streptosporangiaceae bacterium]
MVFGILGPLEVRRDGALIPVGGPRQRTLLAVLLCHANRVVSRDQLIDELLGDQPAEGADRILRVQVSRLRKALATQDSGPRVVARPPGYLLRVEDGELDLHEFEKRSAAGRRALTAGTPDRAAVLLREAESLWRGRPLAGLESAPSAQFEAQRLQAVRIQVTEDRIDAELATGWHAILCPELEQLVAEHPLHERLRGQLMLALYRCGRQADALETYRAARSLLVEELAVEPGPELKQLHRAILEQDTALNLLRPRGRPGTGPAPAVPAGPPATKPASGAPASRAPASKAPEPAPRRRRTRRVLLASGVAVVLAALAAFVPLDRHVRAAVTLNANVLALVSAHDGTVRATVPLPAPPADVAAGSGSLWVAEPDAGLVARIDPQRRTVTATIPVGTNPRHVVATGGQVWVLDPSDRTLSRIDPRNNTVAQTIAVDGPPGDLLLSAGLLWVASSGDGTVLRISPGTGRILGAVRVGGNPAALAATDGAVWAAASSTGTVTRIDARTATVTDTIRVGDAPAALAADPSGLWVLDPLDATAARVDPRRDTVGAPLSVGGEPTDMVQSGGSLWIADQNGTLSRLAPGRGVVTRFGLGGHLSALADDGGLWAAVDAAGAGHRGGTLTTVYAYDNDIDTLDPAASTSINAPPTILLGLVNDGLVTLNHAAGPDGSRLVPDLALALPVPADHGRTYTFHLRPGIRYSTGALVRPRDVTRSFERLFQLNTSGGSYFGAISGAAACQRTPATCDLSAGIVSDDRSGTVTFHLTEPDPDFLYKLTLAYADVLPASTPGRQARAPLPATGPYLVSRYRPNQDLLLVRNPRFREWSAAAQPDGYPDRILFRLDRGPAQAVASVARGTTDFMASLGSIPGDASYFLRHRGQLRINPLVSTSFMFLDVNTPPFNDLRVRQAVNLALDRGRVAADYGGPLGARPTCQVLPPGLDGYQRYCPWTSDPAADGSWHGPDLGRARRLVAASGTAGMKVTVWNSPSPKVAVDETQELVRALRQLGYRASLRLLPNGTYFTYTNDSRNQAQVVDGGWSADYASADDFIGKLACDHFVPADGPATTDTGEFCDPAVDRQIAQAAAEQATDPAAAATVWARLDRQLTDLAIWVPTVVPNEVDLLSRRTGNYQHNPIWGVLLDQLWVR